MKSKLHYAAGLVTLSLILPAAADIIYGRLQQTITTDYTGLTVNVGDGTLNPFFGGASVANNNALQPFRVTNTGGLATIMNFEAGTAIGSGSGFLATGAGGSIDHLGAGGTFTAGTEGYVGFKLDGANYGWMRVVLTNNTSTPVTPVVKDWAYDNTGAAIKTGWIQTDFVSGTAQAVTLNPGTGESFTLGSPLANASGTITNSVVKTGAGTAVLTGGNTYSGTTTVNAGTLVINSNQSTAIGALTVNDNATLGGSGIIGGTVNVSTAGTISPGNSAGNLTLNSGLTLAGAYLWELGALSTANPGSNYDTLTITSGTADITAASLGLNLGLFAPSADPFWQTNQTWAGILNNTGAGALTGAFTISTDQTSWASRGAFTTTSTSGSNDVNLVWTAVPEPNASMLVGGLGVLALLRRRRIHHPALHNPPPKYQR